MSLAPAKKLHGLYLAGSGADPNVGGQTSEDLGKQSRL